jgi:SAM-dependent methyltransferase
LKKYDVLLDSTEDKRTSAEKTLDYISPNSTVLEFGPAYGRMTQYLKEKLDCKVYIVEIDPDGYEKAIKFADGGICADILGFSWLTEFKNIFFDYILFVDVLEHLMEPKDVLEKSVSLLKDNGSVVIAVPNIAHNSILINLINNRFEYTSVGLLDNTHIRFFTYYSLIEMLDASGLVPVIEDGTIYLPEHTELGNSFNDLRGNTDIIEDREFANVYQFVFKCYKKRFYYENEETHKIQKLYKNSLLSSCNLYLDTGNGFNLNEIFSFSLPNYGNRFTISTNIASDVKSVRFDPVEGEPCIINNLTIVTDNGALNYAGKNGIEANGIIFFNTIDPQIIIDFNGVSVSRIKISGEIYKFAFDGIAILSKLKNIVNEYLKAENIKDDLRLSLEKIADLNSALKTERINANELIQTERINANELIQNITSSRDSYKSMYASISRSTFWRITKPFRFIVDCFKFLCRKLS